MAAIAPSAAPSWFRAVAWLAVLWNAFGVVMYLHSVGLFGDPMTDLSAAERAAAESLPAAITAAFAVGTLAGLLGSIGLALCKRWAWPVLLVSAVALVVLESWILFLSGHRETFGLGIPVTVAVVALLLAWLAHRARSREWLR